MSASNRSLDFGVLSLARPQRNPLVLVPLVGGPPLTVSQAAMVAVPSLSIATLLHY